MGEDCDDEQAQMANGFGVLSFQQVEMRSARAMLLCMMDPVGADIAALRFDEFVNLIVHIVVESLPRRAVPHVWGVWLYTEHGTDNDGHDWKI